MDPDEDGEPKVPHEDIELAFEKVTDKEDLEKLFHASQDDPHVSGSNKADLREKAAWHLVGGHDGTRRPFSMPFGGFVLRLRTARGGVDTKWLINARNARKSSKKLNWHQHLGLLMCLICFVYYFF